MVYTQEQIDKLYKKIIGRCAVSHDDLFYDMAKIFHNDGFVKFPNIWDYVDENILKRWKEDKIRLEYNEGKHHSIYVAFWDYILPQICREHKFNRYEVSQGISDAAVWKKYNEFDPQF